MLRVLARCLTRFAIGLDALLLLLLWLVISNLKTLAVSEHGRPAFWASE